MDNPPQQSAREAEILLDARTRLEDEIRQRKLAEASLGASEEQYRSLIEDSGQGIVIDRDAVPVFANHAYAKIFGYAGPEEILGLGSLDPLYDLTELPRVRRYRRARQFGRAAPVQYELRGCRKNGAPIWIEIQAGVIDWKGMPAVQTVVMDISRRKAAEMALRQSEARLRQIIDLVPHMIYAKDRHGRYLLANRAVAEVHGTTVEQLMRKRGPRRPSGKRQLPLFLSDDSEVIESGARQAVAEAELVNGKGPKRILQTTRIPFTESGSEEPAMLAVAMDITERRHAEAALRASEARFKGFAETAADWFWETDTQMHFSYVSGRVQEILGLAPEQMIGCTHQQVCVSHFKDVHRWDQYCEILCAKTPFEGFEYEWIRPDGETRVLNVSGNPCHDGSGIFCGYRGAGRDVTETHRLAREMAYRATHDPLTGLVNRTEFEQRLRRVLSTAQAGSSEHALCYLDLDQFKVINDTCGHIAGDELLRELGQVLRKHVRTRDTVARLGGDEFGVLMEHCGLAPAKRSADSIRKAVEDFRFCWEDKIFIVGVSIGMVPINRTSPRLAEVLSAADTACYTAKDEGRNRVHVYHPNDEELAKRHGEMRWVTQINQALEENRFRLSLQPIVPIEQSADTGDFYEVLVRLEQEDGNIVPASAFLPAAERYNLSRKVDRWVIQATLEWLSDNPGQLNQLSLCSINLSGLSLGDEELLEFIVDQLERRGIDPQKICFEATETAAVTNLPNAVRFIRSLKQLGCRFALDDFGSGLSSFAYLKNLPVDFLKIDGLFVKDIAEDSIDLALVRSINEIGHVMGKKTVAQFVENKTVADMLRGIGVDYVQGYFIGRPRLITEIA